MTDSESRGRRVEAPAVGLAEREARWALDAYPRLVTMGVAFSCLEQVERRWRILATGMETPQQARDTLAHLLLVAASEATADDDRAEYRRVAGVLDRERHDEVTAVGRRFRVGRIERSVRTGPDGPEPPRSSDPEGVPGEMYQAPRRSEGFINEVALTGTAAAATRYELRNKVPECDDQAMADDAGLALETHQQLVLLPAEFVAAEEVDGRWRPRFGDTEVTPQGARDRLAAYLRPSIVRRGLEGPEAEELYAQLQELIDSKRPAPEVSAEWEKAADRLDREQVNDLSIAGFHFRIIRIDQIIRLGPDGPEPPRPSDPDPDDPPGKDQ